ncbi:MAG: sugar ABC transporter substrate-binding protein [Lachnospiraceae bacterium]|jgi:multiple sugar transport system substrate-binding protein|nr:sugar ABC transporter substrate-binding protein [Lachnospiraceae bacterium]
MKKKIVTRVLAVTLATLMVFGTVGCGSSKKSEKSSKTLTIWSMGADNQKKAAENMVKIFQKEHPDIKVDAQVIPTNDNIYDQKMATALTAGTGPDVLMCSPDWYGLYSSYFEDLNPYVKKDGVDIKSKITEGMLDPYYRPDGKLEGLPTFQNAFALAYNKDMFDKYNVDYPTDDWTWEDVAKAGEKFVSGEGADATYGMVNHWVFNNFSVIAEGGKAYSKDLKTLEVNSPEVKKGLTLFGKLIKDKVIPDDSAAKTLPKEQLFVSQHAAMYPLGGFETKLIADEIGTKFNWDVVTMPKTPNNGYNNIIYAGGYAMLKTSKNKDAAWQFIKEASYDNEEMGKATAGFAMPGNKTVAEGYFKNLKYGPIDNTKYLEGLSNAKLNMWGGSLSEPGNIYTQVWQSVTIDGQSADKAMKQYYPSLKKAWDEVQEKQAKEN